MSRWLFCLRVCLLACSGVGEDGKCTGCISVLYEVTKEGGCELKKCEKGFEVSGITGECRIKCGKSEQEIDGECYVLPPFCEKMAPHRACEKCNTGYNFDRGDCVPNH